MTHKTIRVLVVDDHEMVRAGIISLLETSSDIEVVGEASDGQEAITAYQQLQPDIVLMDIIMPILDGIQAATQIHTQYPNSKIIALTGIKENQAIRNMIEAGAMAYLLKNSPITDFIQSIKAVYAGNNVFSSEILPLLIKPPPTSPNAFELSQRELEVLRNMIQGLNNRQIALELNVTLSTVKFHVANIIKKLTANNRVEAVAIAIEHRIIKD